MPEKKKANNRPTVVLDDAYLAEEERRKREHLFAEYKKENLKIQQVNYEHLDKSLFTASAGSLVLTITFIHDVVPVTYWTWVWVLISAWICFVLSILSLIFSFKASNMAINARLVAAENYYLNMDDSAFNANSTALVWLKWLNTFALIFFIFGASLTVVFATINIIHYREAIMAESKSGENKSVKHSDAVPPTEMQKIPTAPVKKSNVTPANPLSPQEGKSNEGTSKSNGGSQKEK